MNKRRCKRGIMTRRMKRTIDAQIAAFTNADVYGLMFPAYDHEFMHLASEVLDATTERRVWDINARINDLGWDLLSSGHMPSIPRIEHSISLWAGGDT